MTLPHRDNLIREAPGDPTAFARLSTAVSGFIAAWRRPLPQPESQKRQLEAGLVLAIVGAILVIGLEGDAAVTLWARGIDPVVVQIFARITQLGTSGYIFAISTVVLIAGILLQGRSGSRRGDIALDLIAGRAGFVIAVNAVSGIASQLLKHLFGRARPKLFDIVGPFHFDTFGLNATFASFPSGHTITAFATAVTLGYFAPRLRWPLLALAVLIGMSRVIIGAHYPSDVIAGAAIGAGTTILLRRAFLRRGLVFQRDASGITPRGAGRILKFLRRPSHP